METPTPGITQTGFGALLTPDNCVLLLIDLQPFQFAGLRSHNTQSIINNVVGLAKTSKGLRVPMLLTTVTEERGGFLLKRLLEIFPGQKPIDQTWIKARQDYWVIEWIKKTGIKKIVIAALWTEIYPATIAIQATSDGYDAYIVTDTPAGVSIEAHQMGIHRMIQLGLYRSGGWLYLGRFNGIGAHKKNGSLRPKPD
jgi:nicotinamidase-related amidase